MAEVFIVLPIDESLIQYFRETDVDCALEPSRLPSVAEFLKAVGEITTMQVQVSQELNEIVVDLATATDFTTLRVRHDEGQMLDAHFRHGSKALVRDILSALARKPGRFAFCATSDGSIEIVG